MTAVICAVVLALAVFVGVMVLVATAGDKKAAEHRELMRMLTPYTPDPSRSREFDENGRPW